MNTQRKWSMIGVVLAVSAALMACSTFTALQNIVNDTAAALPIIEAAGVPIPANVVSYVGDVANCIGMQTGTPTPAQLVLIASCLATQVEPQLAPGIPQAVAAIVALVAKDVAIYLTQNPPATSAKVAPPSSFSAAQGQQALKLRARAQVTAAAAKQLSAVR